MNNCTIDKKGRSGLFIDFIITRPLTSNCLTMFLLISQMVTTFNKTYLEMVIEVNATLLLVLTTYFMGISESLPMTGYTKMIDIWMIFTMSYPFVVITLHCLEKIAVDRGTRRINVKTTGEMRFDD